MIDSTFLRIQLARLLHETDKDLETAEWCAENSSSEQARNKWSASRTMMSEHITKFGGILMGDTQDTIQKRIFERGALMEKIYKQIMESQNRDVARRIEAEKRANVLEDALMSLLANNSAENRERVKQILVHVRSNFPTPPSFEFPKTGRTEYLEE